MSQDHTRDINHHVVHVRSNLSGVATIALLLLPLKSRSGADHLRSSARKWRLLLLGGGEAASEEVGYNLRKERREGYHCHRYNFRAYAHAVTCTRIRTHTHTHTHTNHNSINSSKKNQKQKSSIKSYICPSIPLCLSPSLSLSHGALTGGYVRYFDFSRIRTFFQM